jgi:hypothetical protein
MAMLLDGKRVAERREEYGVRWDDFGGDVCKLPDEDEAFLVAAETGGEFVSRMAYVTEWEAAEEDAEV